VGVLGLIGIGAVVSVALLVTPLPGDSQDASRDAPTIKIAGPEELVYDWSEERCAKDDIPDISARAFRDFRGRVHLIASHSVTRSLIGRSLDDVRHRCRKVFGSDHDPNPANYNDLEWLNAPYTLNGRNVFALVHEEYHGRGDPRGCPSGSPVKCWLNAVTLAVSDDGGRTFSHARPPTHRVASIPYRYVPDAGPIGVFSPSNIVRRDDGYFYSLLNVNPYRDQPGGACVARTRHLDDPRSWRAWGGESFNVRFMDPYREVGEPSGDHICRPVSPDQIGGMTQSLTYNTHLEKFVLVGTSVFSDSTSKRDVAGIYYAVSDDLIRWHGRRLLAEVELISTFSCGDASPAVYPSLLDPRSKSRNFETTGRRPYLYFVRFHDRDCELTLDRDLVRVPVEISG
jgi:hypothetical protein